MVFSKAVVLFKLAVEQGDACAQFNLGAMYDLGHGIDQDDSRAVDLYTLAADEGHADAQHNLGIQKETKTYTYVHVMIDVLADQRRSTRSVVALKRDSLIYLHMNKHNLYSTL